MPLFLLPNLLGFVKNIQMFLPQYLYEVMGKIDGLIAESEGGGRRYLAHFSIKKKSHEIPIALLKKDRSKDYLDFLLQPVLQGETWGIVSDAGLPCLADPGAHLIRRAQELDIPVEALVGPSSIILALMLSGLSGQQFFFHGYLSKYPEQREKHLRRWEQVKDTTHMFIEAPHRNQYLLKDCLRILKPNTLFCLATNLTLSDQMVKTAPIKQWKEIDLAKNPTIFLFHASSRG
ncbi:MAG: SAM-dependent methyltransferase [Chlamydiales bacterium]